MENDRRIQTIIEQFKGLNDWEARYAYLIELGKQAENYPEDYRSENFKVKGCQSQVWLYPKYQENKVHFFGDSDASIVKGLVALLLLSYNDRTPDEILALGMSFIDQIGLRENLSMSRANGLNSILKQISIYAVVFKATSSEK